MVRQIIRRKFVLFGSRRGSLGGRYGAFSFGDFHCSWTIPSGRGMAHLVFGCIRKLRSQAKRRALDRPLVKVGWARNSAPPLSLSRAFNFGYDYMAKRLHKDELVARIRSIVGRSSGHTQSVIEIGYLVVNLDTRQLRSAARPCILPQGAPDAATPELAQWDNHLQRNVPQ